MYVNTATGAYPYTLADIRRDNPNVSFPKALTADMLAAYNAQPVTVLECPDYNRHTQTCRKNDAPHKQGGEWVLGWTVEDKTLEDAKEAMRLALRAEFTAARDAGITYNGALVATTPEAIHEIQSLAVRLERVGGYQKIATRSGAVMNPDAAAAQAMRSAVEAHVAACTTHDAQLTEQILNAPSIAALSSINLSAGWP
jgi:hypothetical protein